MNIDFAKEPLGSSNPHVLFKNTQNLDFALNSITATIWKDRFGKNRLSWYGIESLATQSMQNYGYITVKSFELGATLCTPNTVLQWEENGEFYRWDGSWLTSKIVPPGSTPDSTGGIGPGTWVGVSDATLRPYVARNLALNDIVPGKFSDNLVNIAVGDVLPAECNFVRVNDAVYRCSPAAGGVVTELGARHAVVGGVKTYLSHISRHVSGTQKPLNWKLELSVNDEDITADIKAEFGYSVMGFQGLHIDRYDNLVYIGWQTLSPGAVWVTVHDWMTGELVTRLHFPNNVGAPEGLHVYRVAGQRYLLLPYSPSRTIRVYKIGDPRTLSDKTQITDYTESPDLGVRYQFSGWANTLIYENADLGWPYIFGAESGVSNIFNTLAITSLIQGRYNARGTITVDSGVGGRGAGAPKRQGIALGSQRIFAGIGASSTAAAGYTFAGLQGYEEYTLDGTKMGQHYLTPADFKSYWDRYTGLNTYSTENEGIQSCDVAGVEEQYLLQSVRYTSAENTNYRTLNIIRVNCPVNEPDTIDMGLRANPAANTYNPRGRVVNAGRYHINPYDGTQLFTSAQAIAEYLRGSDIGVYTVYLETDLPFFEGGTGADGQVMIPAFSQLKIEYINGDTWYVTVKSTSREQNYTARITKNGGYNAVQKIGARSTSVRGSAGLVDVSIRSPNSLNLPTFAGDWSTGISLGSMGGTSDWQPAGTGNGALWESGYSTVRALQIFQSTTSRLFFRYAGDAIRDGNTGWVEAWSTLNTTVDSGGFIKKASPVVKIFRNGSFDTNRESEGVTVERLGVGEYLITGCEGLNSDPAWCGIDGGFEIPCDRNQQPLIWLDYEVNADGSVYVKTYHRTHPGAPAFAQNNIDGVNDGEPVDIPADQFVSVRVEMPVDSVWSQMLKVLESNVHHDDMET